MLIDPPAASNLVPFPNVRPAAGGPSAAEAPPETGQPRWLFLDATLIGLVAILAIVAGAMAVGGTRHRRAIERLALDFASGAETYRNYLKTHATPPPNTEVGGADGAGAPLIQGEGWTSPSAVGGVFRWVNSAGAAPAGDARTVGWIMLAAFPPSPAVDLSQSDLIELDRRLDDGNLATGRFRTGFNGWPVYLVTSTPSGPP